MYATRVFASPVGYGACGDVEHGESLNLLDRENPPRCWPHTCPPICDEDIRARVAHGLGRVLTLVSSTSAATEDTAAAHTRAPTMKRAALILARAGTCAYTSPNMEDLDRRISGRNRNFAAPRYRICGNVRMADSGAESAEINNRIRFLSCSAEKGHPP